MYVYCVYLVVSGHLCVSTDQAKIIHSYMCAFALLLQMGAYCLAWAVLILATCGRCIGYILVLFAITVMIFVFCAVY